MSVAPALVRLCLDVASAADDEAARGDVALLGEILAGLDGEEARATIAELVLHHVSVLRALARRDGRDYSDAVVASWGLSLAEAALT